MSNHDHEPDCGIRASGPCSCTPDDPTPPPAECDHLDITKKTRRCLHCGKTVPPDPAQTEPSVCGAAPPPGYPDQSLCIEPPHGRWMAHRRRDGRTWQEPDPAPSAEPQGSWDQHGRCHAHRKDQVCADCKPALSMVDERELERRIAEARDEALEEACAVVARAAPLFGPSPSINRAIRALKSKKETP